MDNRKGRKYNVKKGKQRRAIKVLARVIEEREKKCENKPLKISSKKKPSVEEFLKRRRIRIPRELLDMAEYSRRFQ